MLWWVSDSELPGSPVTALASLSNPRAGLARWLIEGLLLPLGVGGLGRCNTS
jgi:hypothetical protein